LTQREQISYLIRKTLEQRAQDFKIVVDDVSITELAFGKEFTAAIEEKQIAQQEAERAKYLVMKAL
jgi:regulator of protease activity HflC (stomatin/prohibitin superfamily)